VVIKYRLLVDRKYRHRSFRARRIGAARRISKRRGMTQVTEGAPGSYLASSLCTRPCTSILVGRTHRTRQIRLPFGSLVQTRDGDVAVRERPAPKLDENRAPEVMDLLIRALRALGAAAYRLDPLWLEKPSTLRDVSTEQIEGDPLQLATPEQVVPHAHEILRACRELGRQDALRRDAQDVLAREPSNLHVIRNAKSAACDLTIVEHGRH